MRKIAPPHKGPESEIGSLEEHFVKEIGAGNGVVRDSHESWYRFLWEVWRLGHVIAETVDEGLQGPAQNAGT